MSSQNCPHCGKDIGDPAQIARRFDKVDQTIQELTSHVDRIAQGQAQVAANTRRVPDETDSYLVDLKMDADPKMVELAQRLFSSPEGRQVLSYLLNRLYYFEPELRTARQVQLRNLAGVLLNLIGMSRLPNAIGAMVRSAMRNMGILKDG